jgi:hypothetical protein
MPSMRTSPAGVGTSGSASRVAPAAIQPRLTSTCDGEPRSLSGVTTS